MADRAQRDPVPPPPTAVVSADRLIVYIVAPVLPLMILAGTVGVLGARHYQLGSPENASEAFFWATAGAIPLSLLLVTWLIPSNAHVPLRMLTQPTAAAPIEVIDLLRRALMYFAMAALVFLAIGGFVTSIYALTSCVLHTCGNFRTYRFALYGLVASVGLVPALALARVALGWDPVRRR